MTNRQNIDRWSLRYFLIKVSTMKGLHDYFYRKIQVVNADRVKKNESIIIAPNHQNALMDAMAFVMGIWSQTIFLTRSDIFKRKLISDLLNFMKMLPVFRIRDGMSNLQKNDEIFDITVDILHRKRNPLLLFPEGNHGNRRRLRPLVKGIFRIAFKAQEKFGEEPGVKIIPAGIDYSHYWKFRQTQLVIFGEPIEVSQYWKSYQENPSKAINQLREDLAQEIRKVMIDIQSEEYYKMYMSLRKIAGPSYCSKLGMNPKELYQKFQSDKKLIAALDKCLEADPERISGLHKLWKVYMELRKKLNVRDWVPQKKKYNVFLNLLLILLSPLVWPLVLLGLLNNWPHYILPPLMKSRIEDQQFWSTAIWGTGIVTIALYHIPLIVLSLLYLPNWWIKLLYLLTLGSSGIFALTYRKFIIKAWARIRYSLRARKKDSTAARLKEKYDELTEKTFAILEEYA